MLLTDITLRPTVLPEVTQEPDGTIEVSFMEEGDGSSALTILLSPKIVQTIIAQLREEGLIDADYRG